MSFIYTIDGKYIDEKKQEIVQSTITDNKREEKVQDKNIFSAPTLPNPSPQIMRVRLNK
jgi:hypothetical protein